MKSALLTLVPLMLVGGSPLGGESCTSVSVCQVLVANVEAIMTSSKEMGCCTHDSCPIAGVESIRCSQELARKLQPCMQTSFGGNRTECVRQAVGVNAAPVCQNMVTLCEELTALTRHIRLATSMSGCPMREGMFLSLAFPVWKLWLEAAEEAPFLFPNFISDQTAVDLQVWGSQFALFKYIVLVGGKNPMQGNVYVKGPKGRWGAVCDTAWSRANAHVVCQQLGFSQAIRNYGRPALGVEVDGPGSRFGTLPLAGFQLHLKVGFQYLLDNVQCKGTESRLIDCPFSDTIPATCTPDTVAGVECSFREDELAIMDNAWIS